MICRRDVLVLENLYDTMVVVTDNMPSSRLTVKDPLYERWRWQVFFVTWLAYAGFYLTRKSFSVAKIELGKLDGMAWNKDEMAWVDGAYLVAYALGQFFWGPLGDRWGTRRVILAGMIASVIAAGLMGASNRWGLFVLLFAFQGLCQSTGWAPLIKNVGEFFSQRERGKVLGIWCSNMPLGALVASALAGVAAQALGWRFAFWAPAACLFLIWILFFLLQRNRPEDVGLPSIERYHGEPEAILEADETPEEEPEGSWKVIGEVVTNRMVWLLAAVYFLLKPTRYVILFWAPLYLNEKLGLREAESGILGSLFDLAGLFGMLLGGYLSDTIFKSRRIPLTALALLGSALLVFWFDDLPATRLALGGGLFALGFLLYIPETLVPGSAAIDFGTKKGASTASGLINGCGSISAIAGGTLPGWIEFIAGTGHDNWHYIFSGLGLGLALATLLLLPQWNRVPAVARTPAAGDRGKADANAVPPTP